MTSNADGTPASNQLAAGIRRERFIPVSQATLMERLAQEEERNPAPGGLNLGPCTEFFRFLTVWRHQTYQQRSAKLKACYLPFSPDSDTKSARKLSVAELDGLESELNQQLRELLTRANYHEIDNEELQRMLTATSPKGLELKVDLGEFDRALLFARGEDIEVFEKWVVDGWRPIKKRFEVPTFKRLFLMLKLKPLARRTREIMEERQVSPPRAERIALRQRRGLPDDPNGEYVYLRLFKDIPKEDLEMLFPNTEVKLRLFDKLKLGVTAGGSTAAGVGAAATKAMAAVAAANPIGLAAAVVGAGGVIFRQVMNVFNTRTKYMMMLAQRLFFHSLANNHGVVTLLLDRGEEEDIKEELLLYFFLLRNPLPYAELKDGGQLDRMVEAFLTREFNVVVDFEIEDAWERLHKDGLLARTRQGLITVQPPKDACTIIERKWRRLMSASLEEPRSVAAKAGV
jgi:hypothetical protein